MQTSAQNIGIRTTHPRSLARTMAGLVAGIMAGLTAVAVASPGAADTNLSEILRREMERLNRGEAPSPPSTPARDERALVELELIPGDLVELRVLREPDMDLVGAEIDAAGELEHPYLKKVRVAGLTVAQARAHIHELLLRDYLVNPEVSLQLVKEAPAEYTVAGLVTSPGRFRMPDRRRPLTVSEAVEAAGGALTRAATKVRVERRLGPGDREVRFDLAEPAAEPVFVAPGDRLVVLEQWP